MQLLISCLVIYIHLSGDIEKNRGPLKDFSETFSISHWNLNSLSAHNFTKAALLKVYLSVQRFDIFCISEDVYTSTVVLQKLMAIYKYLDMI